MDKIGEFLDRHENNVSGPFPWTLTEFVEWLKDQRHKERIMITITLSRQESVFLAPSITGKRDKNFRYRVRRDGTYEQEHIIFLRDGPPYGADLAAFFKDSSYAMSSFFNHLRVAVLDLSFVEDATPVDDHVYVEKLAQPRQMYKPFSIQVKDYEDINTTQEGLLAISKSIAGKITGLTETQGEISVLATGDVKYKLRAYLREGTHPIKYYRPEYQMEISVIYYVIPNQIYFAPGNIGHYQTQFNHKSKHPPDLRSWAKELKLARLPRDVALISMSPQTLDTIAQKVGPRYRSIRGMEQAIREVVNSFTRRELINLLLEVEQEIKEIRKKIKQLEKGILDAERTNQLDLVDAFEQAIYSYKERVANWPEALDLLYATETEMSALFLTWLDGEDSSITKKWAQKFGLEEQTTQEVVQRLTDREWKKYVSKCGWDEKSDAEIYVTMKDWLDRQVRNYTGK